jgi:hypothetical protein
MNPIDGMTRPFRREVLCVQDVRPLPGETSLDCMILSLPARLAIIAASSARVVTESFWKT